MTLGITATGGELRGVWSTPKIISIIPKPILNQSGSTY